MKPKKQKRVKIKAWAVVMGSKPFHPAELFSCYSVFRQKRLANYWSLKRVHPSNKPKVIPVTITYSL